jgi:hypothetical protein
MRHGRYGHCAKGGHPKPADDNFVCGEHAGRGLYTHCAVCGVELDGESRNYVCEPHLAVRVMATFPQQTNRFVARLNEDYQNAYMLDAEFHARVDLLHNMLALVETVLAEEGSLSHEQVARILDKIIYLGIPDPREAMMRRKLQDPGFVLTAEWFPL